MRRLAPGPLLAVLVLGSAASFGVWVLPPSSAASAMNLPVPTATRSSTGLLTWTDIQSPEVTTSRSAFFISWALSYEQDVMVDELGRVSPSSGQVEAKRSLQGQFDAATIFNRMLFVVTTRPDGVWLVGLDPRSLAFKHRWHIAPASRPLSHGSIAVAGGGLWVAGGSLLIRFNAADQVTARVSAERPLDWGLLAASGGSTLVAARSMPGGGETWFQRLDPLTGRTLASSTAFQTIGPRLAGVSGGGLWVTWASGMEGGATRLNLVDMTLPRDCPSGTSSLCVLGSNGVSALVADQVLWVFGAHDNPGAPTFDYCANPATGQQTSLLDVPVSERLLGADRGLLYVADAENNTLSQMRMPIACLSGRGL